MKRALILVGPSAVGKTTVMKHLLSQSDIFMPLRSMTTRPVRTAGDTEYLHVDEATFAEAVKCGELLEHMTYGAHSYGTPQSEMRRAEAAGKCPLLILDLVGARAVRRAAVCDVYTVYLFDRLDVMEARLYERELAVNPSAEALLRFARRKEANIRDYLGLAEYAPCLDLFLENSGHPETIAHRILAAYGAAERTPPEACGAVLARLRADAEKKANYRA